MTKKQTISEMLTKIQINIFCEEIPNQNDVIIHEKLFIYFHFLQVLIFQF